MALLAAHPNTTVQAMLPARLKRYADATIGTRRELHAEFAQVLDTDVAFDPEEHEERIRPVGSGVEDAMVAYATVTIVVASERL